MAEPRNESAPMMAPLVGLLLASLKKATGSSYEKLLEGTPWKRYLRHPPSNDPNVGESNSDEFALVCKHIYQTAGRDLFITFSRYAGVEGGKIFANQIKPMVAPAFVGLKGVALLQAAAAQHMRFFAPQSTAFTLANSDDGVEVVSHNCGVCRLIQSNEPICQFIGDGMRSSYAVLSGEHVVVKEVKCQAKGEGPDCVFRATLG